MLDNTNHYQQGGASGFVSIPKYGLAGNVKTFIDAAVYGEIVQASVDAVADVMDPESVDGPQSALAVVETATATAPGATCDLRTHLYGVCTEVDGVTAGGQGRVVTRYVTVWAAYNIPPTTALDVLTPVMHDAANAGTLTEWDGTGKCIGLLAQAIPSQAANTAGLALVHFDGVTGFAAGT